MVLPEICLFRIRRDSVRVSLPFLLLSDVLVNECSWCDGKTRKYCRKRPGRRRGNRGREPLSKVKIKQKTCKRVSPTRCSPYDGEMAEGCSLSNKNRCISVKAAKKTGSKKSAVKIN